MPYVLEDKVNQESQPDIAQKVLIHTPDAVMPENPPVQKSMAAMLTPLQQSA